MNINEKVSFIRGLAEGLEVDEKKKEVKLISAIIDVLDDIAVSISELEEGYDDVCDQVDAIDEDLYSLEQDFYEDCENDEDDFFYEVTCPTCNETVCLSEGMLLDGEIDCPNCREKLEFDFDDIDFDNCDGNCECGCNEEESCNCNE